MVFTSCPVELSAFPMEIKCLVFEMNLMLGVLVFG